MTDSVAIPHSSPFQRPLISLWPNEQHGVQSLPELIHFNARENPQHVFCKQAELNDLRYDGPLYNLRDITMRDLEKAVQACISWCNHALDSLAADLNRPVALFMESDVGLFIHLAALLEMRIPILLLSARLSPTNVKHLALETGTHIVFLSKKTDTFLDPALKSSVTTRIVQDYTTLLDFARDGDKIPTTYKGPVVDSKRSDMDTALSDLILHSSGTTGLPKPIAVGAAYPLVYATCHEFPSNQNATWINISTLPLYHGFGLLAPCLSLSVGLTCCLPPSNIIPSASSVLELSSTLPVSSIMTVPSILDDMLALRTKDLKHAVDTLKKQRFVAIGGGALKEDVGTFLATNDIPVLNHYGVTEIGALAPIFCPEHDYDWHFLRIRKDLQLQLQAIDEDDKSTGSEQRYKLIGRPVGSLEMFEIQDEIMVNQNSERLEVMLLGRRDDMIVLKTGEKVLARRLEDALAQSPGVKCAVCIGQGSFEVVVLVEPSEKALCKSVDFVDLVWQLVQEINPQLDQHARISSREAIIVKSPEKSIPRSDKGSIMRREVGEVFADEIKAAYDALEFHVPLTVLLNHDDIEGSIRAMLNAIGTDGHTFQKINVDHDFFETGMDSLQTMRFTRMLATAVKACIEPNDYEIAMQSVTVDFVYQNSSIRRLSTALTELLTLREQRVLPESRDRATEMTTMLKDEIEQRRSFLSTHPTEKHAKRVVVLTGSTGNLGAHVLGTLVRDRSVKHIICLNRPRTVERQSNGSGGQLEVEIRQYKALAAAGVDLDNEAWQKIRVIACDLAARNFGMTEDEFQEVVGSVTHIVHLAWPVDFNRKLASFGSHIRGLYNLLELARTAHHKSQENRIRVLFSSSIAVLRHYVDRGGQHVVPEKAMSDPLVTTEMGYAEAKWVCEQIMEAESVQSRDSVETIVVRIGQLCGPEGDGIWKAEEHIPALLQASQTMSMFPRLEGSMSWLHVDRASRALVEILFQPEAIGSSDNFFHLENPVRQSMADFGMIAADALGLSAKMVPFGQWLDSLIDSGHLPSLHTFFRDHFQALASGQVTLALGKTLKLSRTLRGTSAVSRDSVVGFVERWRRGGFL